MLTPKLETECPTPHVNAGTRNLQAAGGACGGGGCTHPPRGTNQSAHPICSSRCTPQGPSRSVGATLVGPGPIELRTSQIRTSRWTVRISKRVICTAQFKFKTLYVQKCQSTSSHLGSSKFDFTKSYQSGSNGRIDYSGNAETVLGARLCTAKLEQLTRI